MNMRTMTATLGLITALAGGSVWGQADQTRARAPGPVPVHLAVAAPGVAPTGSAMAGPDQDDGAVVSGSPRLECLPRFSGQAGPVGPTSGDAEKDSSGRIVVGEDCSMR